MPQQYLKTWMGVTSGTLGGRDDGYPERKFRLFNDIDEMAKDEDRPDQEFFHVNPVDPTSFASQFAAAKQRVQQQRSQQEINRQQQIVQEAQAKLATLQQGP